MWGDESRPLLDVDDGAGVGEIQKATINMAIVQGEHGFPKYGIEQATAAGMAFGARIDMRAGKTEG